jgi:hypothetical protein
VEQGAINHLRYLVKTRTQAGVSHLQVIQLLQAEGYNVVHTEIEAFESNLVKHNINANGMTLYLCFANVDDALNMRDIFYLDGHEVRLWHKGRFECATCGQKGHKADRHDEVDAQKQRSKLKRKAFKRRRQAK